MTTRFYDPNRVSIIIAGLPISSGFAEEEMITIERESDAFTDVVGVDGEVSRSKLFDNRATVKLKLMQTSPNNALLTAMYLQDKLGDNGAGVGPFAMKDKGGTTLYTAEHCWISKPPDVTMATKATAREWTIRVASLLEFAGGN